MNEDAQALRDEGLDPDDPAVIAASRPCPMGTLARYLSHRTRTTGVRAPCPGHHKGSEIADYGARVLAVGALAFELFHTSSGRLTICLRLSTADPTVCGIVKNPTAR